MTPRTAEIARRTAETQVELSLALEGTGAGERSTGIGFFDHMLDLLARHGHLDLDVTASGDLQTGGHHTVEDVGICLGQALDEALGDRAHIARYGQATVPMDEARAACAVDISGRGLLDFDYELTEEFFRALAANARLTLHLEIQSGSNVHHMIEAAFKASARALRAAVVIDPTETGIPSTKGSL
jgi:imidazoleglycerol-phosphate dehydratase